MNRKFVSIYFTPTGILVTQLAGRKKIKVSVRVDMPAGLLKNNKVQDPDLLAQILKKIWKQYKIKEKNVGLVVPEFSAFTKTLSLNDIDRLDLDEAVRWQASDYLPWPDDDTLLDWKTIKEDEGEYQILSVALERKSLEGFIEAVSKAGLFPIVVETPTLSLVRISTTGDVGKMIFYLGKNQHIILISEGEKVFGSSVMKASDLSEVINTANRMRSHYSDVNVEVIEVGGQGITNEFVQKASKDLGIPLKQLGQGHSSIPKDIMQRYLIPVSNQFMDTSEPDDEYSINLIPHEWVSKYRHKKKKVQIWSLTLFASYFIWFSFFTALAAYLFVSQQISSKGAGGVILNNQNSQKVELVNSVREINVLSSQVKKIDQVYYSPQEIMNSIYAARPEGLSISHWHLDLDTGEINLSGSATDRGLFLLFKKNLEENEDFSIVEIPIASLESDDEPEYTMSFRYLPISAKKGGNPITP